MSLFVIIARNNENSAHKREIHLDAHLKCLQELSRAGQLFAAGPIYKGEKSEEDADICGSLLILDFPTLAEANTWFENEAYYQNDIYKEYEIKPYLDAIPYC